MIEFFANEYNEEAWNKYISCFDDVNKRIDGIPQEIVNAVLTVLGDETGYNWLHTPLHRLGNKTAIELLKTQRGEWALKAFIMRLPS